jgi:polar amino acid transport system substrate-binding protein
LEIKMGSTVFKTGLWWRVLVLCLPCWASQAETLVLQGDEDYPPISYLRDGKVAGVLPAILRLAEPLTGDTYILQVGPWNRVYALGLRGEAGVYQLSFNQERAALFDYSKPYYNDDIQIVTLKERSFPFRSLQDLRGKRIGGVSGASYGQEVDHAIAQGLFTVDRDVGQVGRLRKLLAGRLDAAFIGNGPAGVEQLFARSAVLRNQRDRFAILPVPVVRDSLYVAFAKSMQQRAALDRFDAAIAQLQKSGELARIVASEIRR